MKVKKVIKVENLSFSYSKEEAVKNISFQIDKGSWVSIIGHNGSGKSTLAKLLVGLLEPNSGSIYIDGILLSDNNLQEIRTKIGIVFQNPDNQFVGVTVKHDIAFGLENKRVPREEMIEIVKQTLKDVNMEKHIDSEPHRLSGGEKQRVAIAGALAMNQDVIIFDEATSMLDPEGCVEVVNLIKKLNQEHNKTIVTITHDLNFARLSDRIIVLVDGEKRLDGSVDEVFKEEKLLVETGLEVPLALRLYNRVINDESLKNNKELVNALWTLSSKK